MARPLLYEGFVVLNCDVLFHPRAARRPVTSRTRTPCSSPTGGDDQPPFGDEEMKVQGPARPRGRHGEDDATRRGRRRERRHREVRPGGRAPSWSSIMDRLVAAGGLRDWAPRAFGEFAQDAAAVRHRHARLPVDRDRLSGGLPARGARDPAGDRVDQRSRRDRRPARCCRCSGRSSIAPPQRSGGGERLR